MKRIINGALALLLISGAVQAQSSEPSKGQRKHGMEQLNLSAEQQQKLATLRENHHKAFQDLKQQEDKLTAKEWKARRQELAQKQRSEMNALLTPAQQEQLKQARGAHHQGVKGARKGGRNMAEELSLSDVQKAKVKTLNEGFRTRAKALRSNTALADAQKKEQMKALAQQHRQELKALLTPEQQQKWESRRPERRNKTGK